MDHYASRARRSGAPLLIGLVSALSLAVPGTAGGQSQEKTEAAQVAKKVQKALGTAQQAEDDREALRQFQDEVKEYADLHSKQVARLGPHDEPVAAQHALAQSIAAKRAKAKPGDIFQPQVQPLFRRLIAEQLQGPDALAARKAVLEGNPAEEVEDSVPVVVRVNAAYPAGATRSTVPPSVLLTLPPLPAALHYRFVGRDLILVDSVAQIIVDFLPAAAPELASK